MGSPEISSHVLAPGNNTSKETLIPAMKVRGYPQLAVDLFGHYPKLNIVPTLAEIAEEKLLQADLRNTFEDPEITQKIIRGFEKAFDSLPPRSIQILKMYYGLDNPKGIGMTQKEIGQQIDPPVTGVRVGQILGLMRRKLRNPIRSLDYKPLLNLP